MIKIAPEGVDSFRFSITDENENLLFRPEEDNIDDLNFLDESLIDDGTIDIGFIVGSIIKIKSKSYEVRDMHVYSNINNINSSSKFIHLDVIVAEIVTR